MAKKRKLRGLDRLLKSLQRLEDSLERINELAEKTDRANLVLDDIAKNRPGTDDQETYLQ